jgi:acetolactate synthase I/II/III large subunit
MSSETIRRSARKRESSNGAHALLATLQAQGVRYLFGVPGHGAYPIYDAINDFDGLRTIVGRNEQGITFAALTYAWITGDVAVATSVPEAGFTNSATSLLEATLSQDRVLFIVEADPIHRDIANAVGRYYRMVEHPEDIAPAAQELFGKLRTQRPGAAILEITNRALSSSTPAEPPPQIMPADNMTHPDVGAIVAALEGSRNIAILAGATAVSSGASSVVQEIAERLKAPVFSDGFSKGVLPETHFLSVAHSWTSSGPGEALLCECDSILVIGAPVAAAQNTAIWDPQMVVGSRSETRLAQQLLLVDWDSAAVDALPARARAFGHVPSILRAIRDGLAARLEPQFDAAQLERIRSVPRAYAEERIPWAAGMLSSIQCVLPEDAILLADSLVGVWLERLHTTSGPCRMRFPWGTGTLGYGIPAAVGAKLAAPDREVVVIVGDGAALYNPQELATLRLYDQKVTVVVMNDNCYSAIKHNMTDAFGRSTAHALENPDFVRLGEAFGFEARRLASSDDLPAALEEATSDTLASWLIEVPLELLPPKGLFDWAIVHADAESA